MTSFLEPLHEILFFSAEPNSIGPSPDLVSVIIASYNYQDYIVETLDSVYAQTHPDIELVIVDDCSPDDSVAVMRDWLTKYSARFRRTILARPTENQGLAQTRNSAINYSCGEKIFVLDSDNIIVPSALERHAEVMDRTKVEAVYSQFELFDAERRIGLADFWDADRFKSGNYVDAMAMISRPAWDAVGGYSYFDVMGWEDYDLWLKFIEKGFAGAFIPEILCRYRVHRKSMMHAETIPKGMRLNIEITARHPWLNLEPV